MANNKSNINKLLTAINKLQDQYKDLTLDPNIFTAPFETRLISQRISKEMDIEILNINLFHDTEKAVCYWQIICCGSDSHKYAEELAEYDSGNTVFCHDLEGTRNGMELFSITLIAG